MYSNFRIAALILCFVLGGRFASAQARLTIENNSMRSMAVKVMKGATGTATLHRTVAIGPYSSEVIYFSTSGYYFTKTKATIRDRTPVYRKGQPFMVVNDDTGYSVMTIKFTIKESSIPQVTGGKAISKQEFDQN